MTRRKVKINNRPSYGNRHQDSQHPFKWSDLGTQGQMATDWYKYLHQIDKKRLFEERRKTQKKTLCKKRRVQQREGEQSGDAI